MGSDDETESRASTTVEDENNSVKQLVEESIIEATTNNNSHSRKNNRKLEDSNINTTNNKLNPRPQTAQPFITNNNNNVIKPSSSSSSEKVKVIVRCRPLSKKEETQGHSSVVKIDLSKNEIEVHRPNPSSVNLVNTKSNKIFTFDSVYDESTSQAQLYDDAFRPIVDSVLQGFNGTIFAYGQTGTGKTYTMEGIRDSEIHHGVIPNAFKQIFGQIQASPNIKYLVRASYLEIYQEEIRDLLYKNKIRTCELKESTTSGVFVKDLSSYLCGNYNEINELMSKGNKNRSVGATNMNEHSSRSHAIFMITIEASEIWSDGRSHIRVGKLNLVDLAGSERQGKSGAEGERLKEAVKINLSLSALGNVIGALVDGRYNHIPYRDSKLTRLLQDSLGGNSKTIMVATIGPASFNYDETMTTLRYASRAKRIKNKPKVNEDPKDAMLREYQDEIAKLKAALAMRRQELSSFGDNNDSLSTLQSRPSTSVSKRKRSGLTTSSSTSRISSKTNSQQLQDSSDTIDQTQMYPTELEMLLESYGINPIGLDPKQIIKLLEERRIELSRNHHLVQEEKDKLLAELDAAKSKIQFSDTECNKLVEKIQWFESKVLNGGKNLLDYTNEQQKLIQVKQKELLEQKQRQDDIQRKIQEHMLTNTEINEVIGKLGTEVEYKEVKAAKLCAKIDRLRENYVKTQDSHGAKRVEMENCQMELQKEIKLKKLIIEHFIPPSTRELIEQLIAYNPSADLYYTLPFSSVQLPRPIVDRMITQPLLKRNDDLELKSFPNVYFTDENILQLQPLVSKPSAKIYVPPALDPHVSLLLKRAFSDAEKDLVIDCGKSRGANRKSIMSRTSNSTRIGEPFRISKSEFLQPILTSSPVSFIGVPVYDFIVVASDHIVQRIKLNSTSSTFKSARSHFDEGAQIKFGGGKRLQLRPGSAKGKMLNTKF